MAAKSEERREIFEEASGISKYRYRKEEAERRLNKAEENLVRLRDIVDELYERLGPLKIQAEKAQKFIEYDSEKYGLEIGIWVETLTKSDKLLREFDEKLMIEENHLKEKDEEIESLLAKEDENLRKINETSAKIDIERNEATAIEELAIKTEGEILLLKKEVEFIFSDIDRLNKELLLLDKSKENILFEIEEKTKLLNVKSEYIDKLKNEELSLSKESEENRLEALSLNNHLEEENKKIEAIRSVLASINTNITSLEALKGEISLRKDNLDDLIKQNKEKKESLDNNLTCLEKSKLELENKLKNNENSLAGYDLKLTSRLRKANELKDLYEKSSLDAQEESRRAKILEDLERNYEGFTQSVKAVLKEAERNVLRGILGPVTKIINTPKEYAVAIETALSASMQNVVVETEQDAKNCIYYLKKNNLGRATFMPVSTMKGTSISSDEFKKDDGFIGVASDLVDCESKFIGIKNYLLGRTLVAEDIDTATVIAKNSGYRYKVVTLDGQQVNTGGSLTGGSLAKNSGLLSRKSEIERIKAKALSLKEKADEILAQRKKLDEEIRLLEANKSLIISDITDINREIAVKETEINQNKREITDNTEALNSLNEEKAGVSGRTKLIDEKIAAFKAELEIKEAAHSENLKLINELTLKQSKLSLDFTSLTDRLNEKRMKNFELTTEKELLSREIYNLTERSKLENNAKIENTEKIKELNEKIIAVNELTKEKEEFILKEKSEAINKKNNVIALSNLRNELEAESVKIRNREREASSEREIIVSEFTRLQERRENVNRDYEGIIKKLWDEYELTRTEAEEKAIVIEDLAKAQKRLNELKNKIKSLGSVNVGAVVEYKEVSERYEFLHGQIEDIEKSKLELNKLIGDLTGKMRKQFSSKFEEINNNFKTVFKEMFGGGNAELLLTDDSDILNSGIEIKVHPPGKIVSHIEALSGGEKALVAISIYFAIMKVNPPPFCMLDEVEAALDDVNVRKFAEYLHGISDNTQFIVVTHRRGTMESADTLYGVTMQDDGVSKVLELKNREQIKELEQNAI